MVIVSAVVAVPTAACPFCYCCFQCSWRLAVARVRSVVCLLAVVGSLPCGVVGVFFLLVARMLLPIFLLLQRFCCFCLHSLAFF